MKKPVIGGQAVIEGVMMRGPGKIATAVRLRNGSIRIKSDNFSSLSDKHVFCRLPLVRGVVSLGEMLVIGMQTLTWSANAQLSKGQKMSRGELVGTLAFSFTAAVGIFVLIPYLLSLLFAEANTLAFNLVDGALRLVIFLAYIIVIGMMADIRRVFQYHGAEHKAVSCYESGKKLTVRNCQGFTTLHPRCGTSLIVFIVALSIVLFSFLRFDAWYMNFFGRIALIPVLGGIGYEFIRLSGKYGNKGWFRFAITPGLWTQKLTTREPRDDQVEVAIAALAKVLPK